MHQMICLLETKENPSSFISKIYSVLDTQRIFIALFKCMLQSAHTKGLYRYKRLPFGVVSSPAISQWTKVYERRREELERTLAKVKDVSEAMGMSLGVRLR